MRGTLTEAGRNSPWRDRPVHESLDLFRRMRAGEFPDGKYVLRLKIDMTSPNINLRDPVAYRIRHAHHHRSGDKWCIYPSYDFTHGVSDALENITHSLCTLEFEDHRPLYDWLNERLADFGILKRPLPQQIEFARLNLTYVVLSKRKLIQLVEEKHVDGWDDPRMPTLVGARRRGYTPEGFRLFADRIGVSKADSWIDYTILEDCMREDLNERAQRRIGVLDPIKLVIDNYPEGKEEVCEAPNHPQKPELGKRGMPFSRELWIEREDFQIDPPKGYYRLYPGNEVRLRYAYVVKCTGYEKDSRRQRGRRALRVPARDAQRDIRRGAEKGEGQYPLGLGETCGGGGSAAVRPSVPRAPPRLGRPRLPAGHQPERQESHHRLRRACARAGQARRAVPVRAARILRRRSERPQARQAGVQPRGQHARFVGEAGLVNQMARRGICSTKSLRRASVASLCALGGCTRRRSIAQQTTDYLESLRHRCRAPDPRRQAQQSRPGHRAAEADRCGIGPARLHHCSSATGALSAAEEADANANRACGSGRCTACRS